MSTAGRPEVDAILPLTFMQNALLFHSLSSKDDQGFIHVKVDLNGELDVNTLELCWKALIRRHDVFRSSLHWEKIKTPVQVIHRNVDCVWTYEDLEMYSEDQRNNRIDQFLTEDKIKGFNFNKPQISRVQIFKLAKDQHLFIWSCHHLLWDGWSSSNAIRELAKLYKSSLESSPLTLDPVPTSKDYRRAQKENNVADAKEFWKEYLDGFETPTVISSSTKGPSSSEQFETKKFSVGQKDLRKVNDFARHNNLTITSVLQMAWATVLNSIERSGDVLFGNILSVRSQQLRNADLMCGLFTNMLPVRVRMVESDMPEKLAEDIQQSQGESRDYSFASLEDLKSWADWPDYLPLFDHIFVVENFPWTDVDTGNLKFSNFRSGITSTYPLTVVAKIADHLELSLVYNSAKVSTELIQVLGSNMLKVLDLITGEDGKNVGEIQDTLTPFVIEKIKEDSEIPLERSRNHQIEQPSNAMELTLTRIWEELFGRDGIGIHDNFFEIGGKSLLAVRLFQKIKNELEVNAPPIIILQYPTIAQLAEYLGGNKEKVEWKSLIPLRIKGNKKPLFCLHAKGGYVFFYNQFATYLDEDRPIYALQPRGLNGEEPMYDSIEEMAAHYISEIKTVQPEGPYNILAACFSNAVGLEMAQQLTKQGEEIGSLFMVDAAPGKGMDEIMESKGKLAKANMKLKKSVLYNKGKAIYSTLKRGKSAVGEDSYAIKYEKHLERIFNDYNRERYDGKIILVRSSEYENIERKSFHVEDWLKLVSEENLEKLVVEGHHKTLFLEPEVQNLAKTFNQYLSGKEMDVVHKS